MLSMNGWWFIADGELSLQVWREKETRGEVH